MTGVYQILNTVPIDTASVHAIIDQAVAFTRKKNYPVFPGHDKTVFIKDMILGLQYKIVINNDIACIFSVCYSDELLWREKEKGDAVYLHRIVANQQYKGQRQFQKITDWAIQHAKKRDRRFIRLDTWAINLDIIFYYQRYGFRWVENYITPDTEELPATHRNLCLALLEKEI